MLWRPVTGTKKVRWVVASTASIGCREAGRISVGFGMDVSSRERFSLREKNAFPRGQGIWLNIQSPQNWCYYKLFPTSSVFKHHNGNIKQMEIQT